MPRAPLIVTLLPSALLPWSLAAAAYRRVTIARRPPTTCRRAAVTCLRYAATPRAAGLTADCPAAAASALRCSHICANTPSLHTAAPARTAPCPPQHVCAHTVSLPTAVSAHTAPCHHCATVTCLPRHCCRLRRWHHR